MTNFEIIPTTYDDGKTEFDLFVDGDFRRSFNTNVEAFDFAVANYTPAPVVPKTPVFTIPAGEPAVDFLELLS